MAEDKQVDKKVDLLNELDTKLTKERREISKYIYENIIQKLNDVKNISQIQVHVSSQRQRLVDKSADMRSMVRQRRDKAGTIRKQKYRYYKLEYDLKLNDYEIKNHIESDLESSNNIIKAIENQIQYYKETIDTLDKIVFKIKYLIETEKYLSGTF